MNLYCQSAFHQLHVAVQTIVQMIDKLLEEDLQYRPTANKQSIGELLAHIATLCKADWLISSGYSKKEMDEYYTSLQLNTLEKIKEALLTHVDELEIIYFQYNEAQLNEQVTAYWGVTYSRFEWLIEIVAHLYHHRGQLHAILVHSYKKDPAISLFE
ncbi:MAG: DinB family protein [Bacillaceae bacterium]